MDALKATMSAPTYFSPYIVNPAESKSHESKNHESKNHEINKESVKNNGNNKEVSKNEKMVLVDGGVFANNPELIGLMIARSRSNVFDKFNLFSLGTGFFHPKKGDQQWGYISWLFSKEYIIDTLMESTSNSVEAMAEHLSALPDVHRVRFNFKLNTQIKLDELNTKKILDAFKKDASDLLLFRQEIESHQK